MDVRGIGFGTFRLTYGGGRWHHVKQGPIVNYLIRPGKHYTRVHFFSERTRFSPAYRRKTHVVHVMADIMLGGQMWAGILGYPRWRTGELQMFHVCTIDTEFEADGFTRGEWWRYR